MAVFRKCLSELEQISDNLIYILAFAFFDFYTGGFVLSSQPFCLFSWVALVVSAVTLVVVISFWSLRPFRSFRFCCFRFWLALFSMLYPEQLLVSTELWLDSISLSLGFLKNNEVSFYALERYLAVFPESPHLASVSARDRGENWHESKKRNEGGGGGAYRSPVKTVSLFHWHVVLLSLQLLLKMSLCATKGGISLQCYQRKFLMGARENKIQISQELWKHR